MLAFIRMVRLSAAVALVLPVATPAQTPDRSISRATIAAYSTATPRANAPYAQARRAFEQAYDRIEAGRSDPQAHDSASLRAYPLYPYLQAARIEQQLDQAPDSMTPVDNSAAQLIAGHAGEPLAREMRRAWLSSLAQRAQWGPFLKAYRSTVADPALRCQHFTARIARGRTTGLEPVIVRAWLTPHSLPQCRQAFAWLKGRGALSTQLIAQRARLALQASDPAFAQQIITQLPKGHTAASLRRWAALLEHPRREIDAVLNSPQRSVERKALLAGWSLLARKHPLAAKKRYWHLVAVRRLTYKQASPYALALALGLAWDRDGAALYYFRRVEPRDFNEAAREWRVRAALWSKDWRLALRSIEALPRKQRRSSRWRYWTARAEAGLHHRARARRLYTSLLKDDDYYAALAAARLGRRIEPHAHALPSDPAVIARVARIPAVVRARELFFCGLEHYADAEWRFAYGSLTARERAQSIHLAAQWGWYAQAIRTAADQRVFEAYSILYPRPFSTAIHSAAKRAALTPALVLGVIRQESLYRVDAVSPAGALGLMQLMPTTADRTASKWGLSDPDAANLLNPSVNIALGSAHLRTLLDRFGGRVPLALAGYNAGTRAVLRWLPPKSIPGDIWIENIPYDETRGYVERVLWHSLVFAWLRNDAPDSPPRAWLAPVGQTALAKPLNSRTDHIRAGGRRLSWRHARPAQTSLR